MENDISRNTIFVLVILTLLISILGTWTVLSQITSGPAPQQPPHVASQSGEVSFTLQAPPQPQTSSDKGVVGFIIKKP